MQLTPEAASVRRRLIAASCTLLTASAARGQEIGKLLAELQKTDWHLDSALAYYHEDGRIMAIEPVVSLSRDYGDGSKLDLNFTFDSLSGSSPNGALPSRAPQTFASPSGTSLNSARHLYTTAPGQLPVDPNYSDARVAVGGDWQLPLTRLTRTSLGGKFSYEDDFLSASVNASIEHDFAQKNTTVSFGVSDESDSLHPIGGTPVAGSDYLLFEKTGHKSKNGVGALLGVTQVMSRRWLAELNVSVDRFTGYLNDPYKIVSVIDGSGNTTGYVYENRPDARTRKSAYLENRVGWNQASAALSLRYMTDDWGVHSETAQLRVRLWHDEKNRYVEPTLRWYHQTAANFYTPWISSTASQEPTYAASDPRLGDFRALTYGVKYGVKLDDKTGRTGSEFSIRAEYYQQTLQNGVAGPGALQGLDLYPDLKAFLLQVGFSY
jgi:hypothetical protein